MPTKLGQYIALDPEIRPEEREALENALTTDPGKLQQYIQLDPELSDPEKDQLFGVFKSEMTPAQPGWIDTLANIPTRAVGQIAEGAGGVLEAGSELLGSDPTGARNLSIYGRELAQPLPGMSTAQQFVSDVGSNVLSFAPALLAGGGAVAAGRKALGMAIPIVYGGVHSAGTEYGLAREKGFTPAQAAGVSAAAGASAAGWMALPIGELFNKGGKDLVAKMLGMVVPAGAAGVGMSSFHRGIEGFADYLADRQGKGLLPPGYTLGDAAQEAAYSGAVGVGVGLTTAAAEHALGFTNKAAAKDLETRDARLAIDEQDVARFTQDPEATPEDVARVTETLVRNIAERDAIAAEVGAAKWNEIPATSAQMDQIAQKLNALEPQIRNRLAASGVPTEVRKALSDGLDRLIAEYDLEAEKAGLPNWESTRKAVPVPPGPRPESVTAPGRELQPPTRFTQPEGKPERDVPPELWGERTEAPLRDIPPLSPTGLKDILAGKVPSVPPTEETSATQKDVARLMRKEVPPEKSRTAPPTEETPAPAEDLAGLARLEEPQGEQRSIVGGFPPAAVETEPYRAATILQHVLETGDPEASRTFFAMDKALRRQAVDILKSEGVVKSMNEVQRRLKEVEGNPFGKPLPPKSQAAVDLLEQQRLEAEKIRNTPEGEELFPKKIEPVQAQEKVEGHSQAYLDETNRLLDEARATVKARKGAEPTSAETVDEYINRNPDRARGREPLFSFEYLIARKSVAAVKWLGTRLESVFRHAVDALGRGADYFSWAKDAVRRFGVGIMKTARNIWRSAVSGYREFTADLGRRGGVISPEKMVEILAKSGEPTKKLTEKEIIERRPFTEGQMAQAAKEGGLKAVQQEVGNDRTAMVNMFGRAANILQNVATPKELADILNVMDYNQLKHKALQSGLTPKQREQRKIPFTDPKTGKTVPGKTEGPVTWAEQDRFARLSGKSWADAAKGFHADPTRPLGSIDQSLLDRGVEAAHTILSAAQTVATNNPNSPGAQESMVMARNLYDAVIGARVANDSLAGRALNAAKRLAMPERNLAKLKRMIESQDVELTKAQNDLLAKLDPKNPRYIQHAEKILGLDTFSKFYSFYLGNILSGAATHTRNAISGITGLVSQVSESGVAAMLDIGLGMTKDTGRSLTDPATLILAYGNAFKDAGRVAFQAFFEGAPPEGLAKAMGPVESKAVTALTSDVEMQSLVKGEMMPRAIQGFVSKNPDALWRMIETPMHVLSLGGRVPQVTGNLLRATDLFFRVLASVGKLNMDAVRAARKEGLSPVTNRTEFEKFVGDRMTAPSPEALEAAAKEGMYRVFADPIQQDVVEWLLRAKASNSYLGRVLQLLLPFVKTPYNILKQGIERSPLGFAEVIERMKMDPAKGGLTREMLADELAKPVLGTILLGTAAYAVAMGWMTGAGPKDKGERDRRRASGWQPYSWRFRAGGKERYVGFDSMEPLMGTTMAMMVDAAEAMMRTPKDATTDQIIKEAVYGTLGAVAKNLHNKTFLRGFWNGIDAASDPDRYMEGFVENFARGIAPASGLRKGMQNAIDPTRYRVDGPVDSYWAMFPTMAANGYLPDLDWLGRPKQMGAPADGVLGATFRLLSPVQYSEESQDPADLLANALDIDKSKPVARLQGGKVELDPVQHNEYIRAQGLLAHRLLTNMAKNLLPQIDTMTPRRKESLKKRIESTIAGYRQNVVRSLTMKWKREGMK